MQLLFQSMGDIAAMAEMGKTKQDIAHAFHVSLDLGLHGRAEDKTVHDRTVRIWDAATGKPLVVRDHGRRKAS